MAQLIPAGEDVTVPLPTTAADNAYWVAACAVNVAVTVFAPSTVTLHVAPLHVTPLPLQPVRVYPLSATAVSVTWSPTFTDSLQSVPQEMPPVEEVTVPEPTLVTVSVAFAGRGSKVALILRAFFIEITQSLVPEQSPWSELQPPNR